jgi:hypothetical protein
MGIHKLLRPEFQTQEEPLMTTTRDGNANVDGLKLFNLEAGPVEGPKLLLIHRFPMLHRFPILHGFRSAGRMFHEPIPALPDVPGQSNRRFATRFPAPSPSKPKRSSASREYPDAVGFSGAIFAHVRPAFI